MTLSATVVSIRPAQAADLDAINRIVEAAVMSWQLPERVKRLSLPSYHYNAFDLDHQHIVVAEQDRQIVGVAAWEAADPTDTPDHQQALLLHGIYVHQEHQQHGIGSKLFAAAEHAACTDKLAGVLVKAQADAVPFFNALGLQRLEISDQARDYANRFWKACPK